MIQTLNQIDTQIFLLLNGWHNGFFDQLMWAFSSKTLWIPMYLILIYFLYRNYQKETLYIFLATIIAVALADSLSVALFKDVFMRYRPSHNPSLESVIHLINNYKGGNYGFISSHAANTFALACILNYFLKSKYKYFPLFIFSWAAIVSYSRIYLGVHYPGDIICGAVFGSLIAYIVYRLYKIIKLKIRKSPDQKIKIN